LGAKFALQQFHNIVLGTGHAVRPSGQQVDRGCGKNN
jgi:hypothetical protein